MKVAARGASSTSGSAVTAADRRRHLGGERRRGRPTPAHAVPTARPSYRLAEHRDTSGGLGPGHEGHRRLDLVLPPDEERVHVVDARRLHVDDDMVRPGHRVGTFLDPQQRRWSQLVADDGAHGPTRYRQPTWTPSPPCAPVRPGELALLPPLERAADTVFEPLGIGPLPGPGTVAEFAAALVVLVAGDPPVGLCRIDAVGVGRPPRAALCPSRPRPSWHRARPARAPPSSWAPRPRLRRAHPRHLPRRALERALLRVGGLRRGRPGRRVARRARPGARRAGHDRRVAPASS